MGEIIELKKSTYDIDRMYPVACKVSDRSVSHVIMREEARTHHFVPERELSFEQEMIIENHLNTQFQIGVEREILRSYNL